MLREEDMSRLEFKRLTDNLDAAGHRHNTPLVRIFLFYPPKARQALAADNLSCSKIRKLESAHYEPAHQEQDTLDVIDIPLLPRSIVLANTTPGAIVGQTIVHLGQQPADDDHIVEKAEQQQHIGNQVQR